MEEVFQSILRFLGQLLHEGVYLVEPHIDKVAQCIQNANNSTLIVVGVGALLAAVLLPSLFRRN